MKYLILIMVVSCILLVGCTAQQVQDSQQALADGLAVVNQNVADLKVDVASIPIPVVKEGLTFYDNYKSTPTQTTLALLLAAIGGFAVKKKPE